MGTPTGKLSSRIRGRRGVGPATPCGTVLVIRPDAEISAAALTAAIKAGGAGVAVVTTLQIHGYGFGLPNPGLMPNAKEKFAAQDAVSKTIHQLELRRVRADGQIVMTRKSAKAVAEIVKRRGAATVLLDRNSVGRVRSLVEGDLARALQRRLRPVQVQVFASPFD